MSTAIGARALIFAAVHIFKTVNKTNIFYSQSDSVCDSAILPYNFHRFALDANDINAETMPHCSNDDNQTFKSL